MRRTGLEFGSRRSTGLRRFRHTWRNRRPRKNRPLQTATIVQANVRSRLMSPSSSSNGQGARWRARAVGLMAIRKGSRGIGQRPVLHRHETEGGLSYSTPTGESYAAKFDGQDYPYKGNPGVTSLVIKRIDDRTIEETGKRDGSAVYVTRMTVSSDGQSMNIVTDDKRRGTTDSTSLRNSDRYPTD